MRVVIAEDDALLREGLVLLASEGIEGAAATDNPTEFLAAVTAERPDAVIVDIRLPRRSPTRARVLAVLAYLPA